MTYPVRFSLSRALAATLCICVTMLSIACNSTDGAYRHASDRAALSPTVRTSAADPAAGAARPVTAHTPAANASPATTPEAPATTATTQAQHTPLHRQIIYTGSLTLTTTDAPEAMQRIQREAEALGGYLGEWTANKLTIRVPVARFQDAIDCIAKLGSISDKQLGALDVTDQIRDIQARLANAQAMRLRLIALLENAGSMEEMLKVEQEIQRVTELKERLEAQLLATADRAAYSALTVAVVEAQPIRRPTYAANVPFAWINQIGLDLRGGGDLGRANRRLGKGVTVDLPNGFARFRQEDYQTIAMSAEQVMIKVQRHDNFDKQDAQYWARLIERHFEKSGLIDVQRKDSLTVRDGKAAVVIHGLRTFGQGDFGYLVATAVSDDHVFTYEAWGPVEDLALAMPQINASIRTLRASSGW